MQFCQLFKALKKHHDTKLLTYDVLVHHTVKPLEDIIRVTALLWVLL